MGGWVGGGMGGWVGGGMGGWAGFKEWVGVGMGGWRDGWMGGLRVGFININDMYDDVFYLFLQKQKI